MATYEERIDAAADSKARAFAHDVRTIIRQAVRDKSNAILKYPVTDAEADAVVPGIMAGGDPPAGLVAIVRARILARLEDVIPDAAP